MGVVKKACIFLPVLLMMKLLKRNLKHVMNLVIVVKMRIVLSQEAEVNMTESVAVPGPSQWPSCWDKKMWTRCGFIIVYLHEYTLLSFYNSSTVYVQLQCRHFEYHTRVLHCLTISYLATYIKKINILKCQLNKVVPG